MSKYGKLGPDPNILGKFDFIEIFETALLVRFQQALNGHSHLYKTQVYANLTVFDPKCPNMEKMAQTPKFWKFLFF